MALQQTIKTGDGRVASYWRVERIEVDIVQREITASLSGYKDYAQRFMSLQNGVVTRRRYRLSNDAKRVFPYSKETPGGLLDSMLDIENVVPNNGLTNLMIAQDPDLTSAVPEGNLHIFHRVMMPDGYPVKHWHALALTLDWRALYCRLAYGGYRHLAGRLSELTPRLRRSASLSGPEFENMFGAVEDTDGLEQNSGLDRDLAYQFIKSVDPEFATAVDA